jgi:histidine ammonia-lyase
LDPGRVPLDTWRRLWAAPACVALPDGAWTAVDVSAQAVAALLARGEPAYGINTGFGKLAHTHIPDAQLAQLQRNLILSHAVGTGEELSAPVVRLVLASKAASLARGFSGVRPVVIESLLALLNAGITPCIPAKGSVGASGDLAPLAHMTLALMGEGNVRVDGVRRPAGEALREAGLQPLALAPKEGLALINGTQVSTALALHALFLAQRVLEASVAVGSLTVDAARGSDTPFDERIHAVRGQPGQMALARAYRTLLAGSAIRRSHLVAD